VTRRCRAVAKTGSKTKLLPLDRRRIVRAQLTPTPHHPRACRLCGEHRRNLVDLAQQYGHRDSSPTGIGFKAEQFCLCDGVRSVTSTSAPWGSTVVGSRLCERAGQFFKIRCNWYPHWQPAVRDKCESREWWPTRVPSGVNGDLALCSQSRTTGPEEELAAPAESIRLRQRRPPHRRHGVQNRRIRDGTTGQLPPARAEYLGAYGITLSGRLTPNRRTKQLHGQSMLDVNPVGNFCRWQQIQHRRTTPPKVVIKGSQAYDE